MLRTIPVTQEQIEALGDILQIAFEDQSNYFSDGHMESDYDQEGLTLKAKMLTATGQVANLLGLGRIGIQYGELAAEILEAAIAKMEIVDGPEQEESNAE